MSIIQKEIFLSKTSQQHSLIKILIFHSFRSGQINVSSPARHGGAKLDPAPPSQQLILPSE